MIEDDEVVMKGNIEWIGGVEKLIGNVDIRERWSRVEGRVVMEEDDGSGGKIKRKIKKIKRIEGSMVKSEGMMKLVGYEIVIIVEEKDEELLEGLKRNGGGEIIDEIVKGEE